MSIPRPHHVVLLALSLIATWLVWGSSFVAIAFALDAIPPLLLMGSRFVAAGVIATVAGLALSARAGGQLPSLPAWRDAAVVGVGWITIGMGATGWAAAQLPSGVAALLVATAPLWIVALQLTVVRGAARPTRIGLVGVAAGMLGVAIIVAPGGAGAGAPLDVVAALVLVAAMAAWAAASLFAQRATAPDGLLLVTGMQMLVGGAVLLVLASLVGEVGTLQLARIDLVASAAWTFLVLPAAIGGFVAYGWLLANAGASTASTHAFVNPLVAVALGALVLGEQVSPRVLLAGAAIVVAVVLLLVGEARSARHGTTVQASRPERRGIRRAAIRRPAATGRVAGSWSPAPTPAFAARRTTRPWQATDGMDALSIDAAFDPPS